MCVVRWDRDHGGWSDGARVDVVSIFGQEGIVEGRGRGRGMEERGGNVGEGWRLILGFPDVSTGVDRLARWSTWRVWDVWGLPIGLHLLCELMRGF